MADEITLGELARRFDNVDRILRDLPTRAENNAVLDAVRQDIARNSEAVSELRTVVTQVDGNSQRRHEKAESNIAIEAKERRQEDAEIRKEFSEYKDKVDEQERSANQRKWAVVASVALAGISAIFAIFGRVIFPA